MKIHFNIDLVHMEGVYIKTRQNHLCNKWSRKLLDKGGNGDLVAFTYAGNGGVSVGGAPCHSDPARRWSANANCGDMNRYHGLTSCANVSR